jgi:RHS repeat-associated protein
MGQISPALVISDFERSTTINLPENLTGFTESETQEQVEELLEKLCYQYKYDHRNRLVEKKIPGKGWESIVYDNLDRPVLTQDAVQKTQQKWNFTKYDNLGRVVYTGIYTHDLEKSQAQMQSHFNALNATAQELYETKVSTGTGFDGTYYTNSNFPDHNLEVLTVNYYDDYTFNRAGAPTTVNVYGVNSTTNLKSLATGSRIKVLDQSPQKWMTTVTYYDEKARPIYTYSHNGYLETTDIVEHDLDAFTGRLEASKTTHKKEGLQDLIIQDRFGYDSMDRLLSQHQQINSQPEELIVKNQYDALGQLIKKEVGANETDPLQSIDYHYNIRGWLKKINDPFESLGNKLFSMELHYNDYGNRLYNGNISATHWKTASDHAKRRYNYYYDDLNRITSAYYSAWGQNSRFNLGSLSYDKNGNIQRLYRKGAVVSEPEISRSSDYGTLDYLNYTYDGNQLTKVKDNGNDYYGFKDGVDTDIEYSYDANGNMTKDDNKGISDISYNHLNLPKQVTLNGGNIKYTYDATGTKLRKQVGTSITDYAGNYVYKNGVLEFFNTPEGYATPNGLNGFDYIYQYKDHLGNVRLSYTKNPDTSQETVFTDGFESMANWDRSENSFGHSISALDSSKKRSGTYSGRIDDNYPTNGEKYVYSDTWTSITNSNDTFYTVAAWVYVENVADNSAEIYLATRKAGETGYPSGHYVSDKITQKGQWVYVEKSISVPADVRQLNVRIDNNKDGKVWFDDVTIVKGNTSKTLIVEESNYYPFGLKHKGYNNVINGTHHPYGYNGKELNEELGLDWYDFGARNYDPAIGRWMVIDPLAEMSYNLTPYRFAGNNPILFKDPNGLWEFVFDKEAGTLSLNRQEGDTYDSFLEQSGLSGGQAKKLFGVSKKELKGKLNEGGGDSFGVSEFNSKSKIGNMLQGMEESLTAGNVELSQNPSNDMGDAINNCWNCTINLTSDGRSDSNALTQPDTVEGLFTSMLNGNNFDNKLGSDYRNVSNPRTGDAIRYSADGGNTTTHGSVFLLQNDNGVQIFTKNGFANGQPFQIMTQNELVKTYSNYGEAKGRQNYSAEKTNQDGTTTTVTKSDSSPYYRKN